MHGLYGRHFIKFAVEKALVHNTALQHFPTLGIGGQVVLTLTSIIDNYIQDSNILDLSSFLLTFTSLLSEI